MRGFSVLLLTFGIIQVVSGFKFVLRGYCSRLLCPAKGHVACYNEGVPHIRCRGTLIQGDIERAIKEEILQSHNEHRNRAAKDGFKLFSGSMGDDIYTGPAVKMNMIIWNEELSTISRLNILKCVSRFDRCIATQKFRKPGQLIGQRKVTLQGIRHVNVLRNILNDWGKQDLDEATFMSYPDIRNGSRFSYMYTAQYLHDEVTEVGCGYGTYIDFADLEIFILCCIYSKAIEVGEPVFRVGPAASGCNQHDLNYDYLCSGCYGISANLYSFVIICIINQLF